METVGIDRPTSDQNSAGHRGNDDGMSVQGDPTQHGKPDRRRGAPPQPDAREGQAGPSRVKERSVVPPKPGNSGGGKGEGKGVITEWGGAGGAEGGGSGGGGEGGGRGWSGGGGGGKRGKQ